MKRYIKRTRQGISQKKIKRTSMVLDIKDDIKGGVGAISNVSPCLKRGVRFTQ